MHITLNVLADYQLLFDIDTCDEGHSRVKIQKKKYLSGALQMLF